jgi:hypothetical protein
MISSNTAKWPLTVTLFTGCSARAVRIPHECTGRHYAHLLVQARFEDPLWSDVDRLGSMLVDIFANTADWRASPADLRADTSSVVASATSLFITTLVCTALVYVLRSAFGQRMCSVLSVPLCQCA